MIIIMFELIPALMAVSSFRRKELRDRTLKISMKISISWTKKLLLQGFNEKRIQWHKTSRKM